MIRKIAISLLFVTLFASARAQETAFGLKGGLNLSSMNIDDPEASYDTRTGYHLGVFLRGKFSKVAIQPELLLFTQKGEAESATFSNYQNSFTYVSVPVMLKFYPIGGLNLQLGPQIGFLVDGEQKYTTIIGTSGTRDIKDAYKSNDVSLSFGGGYDFNFGLNLDVRYNVGLKDINNMSDGEPAKSRVFLISLGWNFLK